MDPFDPILDQPLTVDFDDLTPEQRFRLANHDLLITADATGDLYNLFWPWAGREYARHLKIRIFELHDDAFMPMVTQFNPGYQETILGGEGIIVSKRLTLPLDSNYDRAVLWHCDCQAEGDRLLRMEVEIDWGEPLSQQMVDGLLVAQLNPRAAQGIYNQRNAESTRVFGNPQGRPDQVDLTDPSRARLTYHVLVNGMVEVAFLLTVSDVGEQVAWNGFLALRDAELAFERSAKVWANVVKTGQLWTPDPRLNRAVQLGRVNGIGQVQRLRTGFAATDRRVERSAALVNAADTVDPTLSRNVLAHLRRVAQKSDGHLPVTLPLRHKDPIPDPGLELGTTNGAYVMALADHLRHHHAPDLLQEHYPAIQLCVERVIARHATTVTPAPHLTAAFCALLPRALELARAMDNEVDVVRWESEWAAAQAREGQACKDVVAVGDERTDRMSEPGAALWTGLRSYARPFDLLLSPVDGADAARAIWEGCGLQRVAGELVVEPQWPTTWWWALLDLPWADDLTITLVWDGEYLHATQPVRSNLPTMLHHKIVALHTDDLDFDLQFDFVDNSDHQLAQHPQQTQRRFRPQFDTGGL